MSAVETNTIITTDHDEIRSWVEAHGGEPAIIKGTEGKGKIGLLRIHFPGIEEGEEELVVVAWEDFFHEFEDKNLAFSYRADDEKGSSPFYQFVERDSGEVQEEEADEEVLPDELAGEQDWLVEDEESG